MTVSRQSIQTAQYYEKEMSLHIYGSRPLQFYSICRLLLSLHWSSVNTVEFSLLDYKRTHRRNSTLHVHRLVGDAMCCFQDGSYWFPLSTDEHRDKCKYIPMLIQETDDFVIITILYSHFQESFLSQSKFTNSFDPVWKRNSGNYLFHGRNSEAKCGTVHQPIAIPGMLSKSI